ncbi:MULTISPECIES: OsmC family protein [unclassified Nocardioides]|jgi:uncharacterized OsmC-like protein|uniref:OsmC family protein n=1 Tax=Nocardioides sp. URHA0032 TaxID=1380388 RepID=UPI00048F5975|nr:hypothetical protein [Nocardioides sp. URHA0032]
MTSARREQLVVEATHATKGLAVTARSHGFTIDEAEKYGGHDAGANPVEHMLAGLAAASLVVLRILGQPDIAAAARLTISATLNVDRVMGVDDGAAFDLITLDWEVEDEDHAARLRRVLPDLAARRPGQALVDGAAVVVEEITARS